LSLLGREEKSIYVKDESQGQGRSEGGEGVERKRVKEIKNSIKFPQNVGIFGFGFGFSIGFPLPCARPYKVYIDSSTSPNYPLVA
jgi:hypothetical protein